MVRWTARVLAARLTPLAGVLLVAGSPLATPAASGSEQPAFGLEHEKQRRTAARERLERGVPDRTLEGRVYKIDPRAEPPLAPPANSPQALAAAGGAAVKGAALGPGMAASSVDATHPATARIVAVNVRREPEAALTARAGVETVPPPPAEPGRTVAKADLRGSDALASRIGLGRTAGLDIGALDTPSPSRRSTQLARARVPLVPIPERAPHGGPGVEVRDGRGIAIAAAPGQRVAAPHGGRVVFARSFRSYGPLLIMEHDREYHTLFWGFSRLEVAVGDDVRGGQIVGVMATQGDVAPQLHVELRQNGRPVNPLPWLAASSSKVRG